jgi:hypothetical protein
MIRSILISTAAFAAAVAPASAHSPVEHLRPSSAKPARADVRPALDVTAANVDVHGNIARFHIEVKDGAGTVRPRRVGKLAGSSVQSYVWPTSLDPAVVGFPAQAGILALAVTAHPDFDDTPLFDEDGNGNRTDDGRRWHSHWVVLTKAPSCGGGLKVVDIAEGETPELPATWPGLPLLIDSPGWQPIFSRRDVEVDVPFRDPAVLRDAHFDAVTAALRVDANLHAPLLCVTVAQDVLSGDLSLPGVFGSTPTHAAGRG